MLRNIIVVFTVVIDLVVVGAPGGLQEAPRGPGLSDSPSL
jgi:hypothetical protein